MIDFDALWKCVTEECPVSVKSSVHGLSHWQRVEQNALQLAPHTGANLDVVRLFALFHDSCRLNDVEDKGHGARGAAFAKKLRGSAYDLDDASLALLIEACERHADGGVSDDPTIGTCWDADRLDLVRVRTIPRPDYMSTPFGKAKVNSEFPAFLYRVKIRPGEHLGEKLKDILTICKNLEILIPNFLACKNIENYSKKYGWSELREFAKEFYYCYQESSGAISNCLGAAAVLKVFRRLAPLRESLSLQNENDWDYVTTLPRRLRIYRGGRRPTHRLALGISWSARYAFAESFARPVESGIVITGTINRSAILAVYLEEEEIVVDPKNVRHIRVHI